MPAMLFSRALAEAVAIARGPVSDSPLSKLASSSFLHRLTGFFASLSCGTSPAVQFGGAGLKSWHSSQQNCRD